MAKIIDKGFKNKILNFLLIVFVLTIFIMSVIWLIDKFNFTEQVVGFLGQLSVIINYPVTLFGGIKLSISSLISFSFFIFIGLLLGKYYKKGIYSLKRKNKNITSGTITILANIGYYIILTFVFLNSLKIIGIDLSSLTMIVSALSVGIGFGLQTIVSNFISGIILMFEQSIKIGDYIEIGDNLTGTVININMRSTTLRTNNNINVIVPNQSFVENNIINRTLSDNKTKIQVPFGVEYGTEVSQVEDVILSAIRKSKLNYIKDSDIDKPSIVMTGMGNNSVDFYLNIWVKGDDTNTPIVTKGKFLRLIYETLNANNISIPFPQTDLHIKDSVPLEFKVIK